MNDDEKTKRIRHGTTILNILKRSFRNSNKKLKMKKHLNAGAAMAIPVTVALEAHGVVAIRKCNLSIALHTDATLVLTLQVNF